MMPVVDIYTDGGYSKKHDSGGWAAYLTYDNNELIMCDYEKGTTNNRMEILAVLKSLSSLNTKCEVNLYTDSQYVVNSINNWIYNWVKNGWKSSSGNDVLNVDLWLEIFKLIRFHKVKAYWVRGHNGHPQNELCDDLATQAQFVYGGYLRGK